MTEYTCPACGTKSDSAPALLMNTTRGKGRPWRRCPACKSYFDVTRYDRQAEVSHHTEMPWGNQDSGKELIEFKGKMYRSVISLLKQHAPPPATLLDVGCSYGGFITLASEAGYRVSGCDILPQAVEYVRGLGFPVQECSSIEDVNLDGNGPLDILTCLDCNCYWDDQPSEIGYAFEKIKPGGYLAMRVVDKSWLLRSGLLMRRMNRSFGEYLIFTSVNDHRFSMPVRSLLRILKGRGFEIVYASPRGAQHSEQTRTPAKVAFVLATLVWKVTGLFVAPGALILAQKPLR